MLGELESYSSCIFAMLLSATDFPFALQLSFQMWTNQIQETLNSKKRGDAAFRSKDLATAIDCYTQVSHFLVLHNISAILVV